MASIATVVIVVAVAIAVAAACILRRRRQWLVVGGWYYHSASDGARGEREEVRVKANMLVVIVRVRATLSVGRAVFGPVARRQIRVVICRIDHDAVDDRS